MTETYDSTTADLLRTTAVHQGGLCGREHDLWKERSKGLLRGSSKESEPSETKNAVSSRDLETRMYF